MKRLMQRVTVATVIFCSVMMLPVCANAQDDNFNYTNPNADQGATSEVDWVRLLEPYWPESTITFYMGNVRFQGHIHNTNGYPTVREITKIAHDVMNDMHISDGMLGNIQDEKSEYEQLSATQWHEIALKAIELAGRSDANPYGSSYAFLSNFIQTLKAKLGNEDMESVIQQGRDDMYNYLLDEGKGKLLDKLDDFIPEAGVKFSNEAIGNILMVYSAAKLGWDLGEFTKKYHIFDRKEWMNQMLQRQILKETFYITVSQKIAELMKERFKNGKWVLEVDTTVERKDATLFGVPMKQKWHMQADLQKIDRSEISRNGTYQGHMKVWVDHKNVGQFDVAFKRKVMLNDSLPFKYLVPYCDVEDIKEGDTRIGEKMYESYDFQIIVDKDHLRMSWPFINSLKQNVFEFTTNHTGKFGLNYGHYDDSRLQVSELTAVVKYTFGFYGKALGNSPTIYVKSQEKVNHWDLLRQHGDYTETMYDFVKGENVKILRDDVLLKPLKQDMGYSISTVNDPYRKLREGSPTYKPPVLPMMKSAPVKAVGNVEDDNEPAGENGLWVYDWKSSMPKNIRETIDRGEAILASGQLPSAYANLLPEGLSKEDDIVIVTDTMLTLSVMKREGIGFEEIVSRVKRNGFIGKTTPGKYFFGSNSQGQNCMVTNMSANGYVTVVIEDASEEDNGSDVELENIGSNMERLQKQMQEISKELMAHPERADELREKILKVSQEIQKETQRFQEKVRK